MRFTSWIAVGTASAMIGSAIVAVTTLGPAAAGPALTPRSVSLPSSAFAVVGTIWANGWEK
jgi:hypothetical protein